MLLTILHISIGIVLGLFILLLTSFMAGEPNSRVKKLLFTLLVLIGAASTIIVVLAYNFSWWYLISFAPAIIISPAIHYSSPNEKTEDDKENSSSQTDELEKPSEIVKILVPFYDKVLSILNDIGPIKHNYFAAIFVVSVAQLRILTYEIDEPKVYADEVISKWFDYIGKNEEVEKSVLSENFEIYSPIYSDLVLEIFDSQSKDKKELQNRSVQLLFQLYNHSTDGETPYMLKVTMLASKIVLISNKISQELK